MSRRNIDQDFSRYIKDLDTKIELAEKENDFQPSMDAINSIFKELENNRKLIGNNTFDQLERIQVASQFKLNSLEKAMSSGIDDEINKTQIDFITFVRRFKRMVNDIWNDLKEKL